MSENKCPFCGDAMITTADKIVVCENNDCATMFNEWDYPKACAAMEWAKAKSTCSRYFLRDEKQIELKRAVYDAEQRVLEVFK